MNNLIIDIETLPPDSDTWEAIRPVVENGLESRYKREGTIQLKKEEAYKNSCLRADFGRILCIGHILEDDHGETICEGVFGWDEKNSRFTLDERSTLTDFWALLDLSGISDGIDRHRGDLIIGHNILAFDLKFIWQRSVVHSITPSVDFPFARYRSDPIFDTMAEWAKWDARELISLGRLAVALGLPSSKSEEVSGDKVLDLFLNEQHEKIRDYCLADVRLTRAIYHRLVFAPREDAMTA